MLKNANDWSETNESNDEKVKSTKRKEFVRHFRFNNQNEPIVFDVELQSDRKQVLSMVLNIQKTAMNQ